MNVSTSWRTAALMVVAAGLWQEPAVAVSDAARADPRYALGYVVVTHYPGVRADGTGDATAGIQAAIEDAYADGKAVLFPPGEYAVSDTLKCYEWNFWHAGHPKGPQARNPDRRNHVLIGSTLGSRRPLIRLKADAPGFGDPSRPRPILAYRVFSAINAKGSKPVEPADPLLGTPPNFRDQPNVLFHSELRGIDVDCGGNRGAVGVAFRAAQDSSIENVKVIATGAEAGFRGIPGRNAGALHIEVEGGRYGLDLVDGGLAGTIAVGARFTNQTEEAVRNRDFCPLTVVGFHIVKERGPVTRLAETYRSTAAGTLCLVDGIIELRGGGLAVDNASAGKTLYLRNVYVRNAAELVRSGTCPPIRGSGGWCRIREYACTDQHLPKGRPPYRAGDRQFRMWSLIDGNLSRDPEPLVSIENDAPPPPADLLRRHTWNERLSCEGRTDETCVATSARYGAVGDDGRDDRAAIQAAIDDAERAGHGRVFLPGGTYDIAGTLDLRRATRLFGVGRLISTIRVHESWLPTEGEPTIVRTVSDPNARTTLAFLTLEARTRGGGVNEAGAHTADRFNHLHWRAGRHSVVAAVNLTKEWVGELYANPHDYVKVTEAGGGRFYFLAPSWRRFGHHPESRALRVVGTSEPLAIYGLNLEFVARAPRATPWSNVEMVDAANVRIYSVKREMPTPTLILRDCHNIALFGHGRQCSAPFRGSGGHLQIIGKSAGVTIAPVVFDTTHGASGEPTLGEKTDGQPRREVVYPEGLSVYKRGQLDDAAMRR
jgi:hypothetical protein